MSSTSSQLSKRVLQHSRSSIVTRTGLAWSPICSYCRLHDSRGGASQLKNQRRDEWRFFSGLGSARNLNQTPLANTSSGVAGGEGADEIGSQKATLHEHQPHSSQDSLQADQPSTNTTESQPFSLISKLPVRGNPRRNNAKKASRNGSRRSRRKLDRLLIQKERSPHFRLLTQHIGRKDGTSPRIHQAADVLQSSRMVIAANLDVIDRATGAIARMKIQENSDDAEMNSEETTGSTDGIRPNRETAAETSGPGKLFDEKQLFKTNTYDLLLRSRDIKERIIHVPTDKPPRLMYGLDRVLFNPGVYHLRNQRTGVFNFDPMLENIDPVSSFDIEAMSSFTTPSEDSTLAQAAMKNGCKYSASTSSSTNLLKHLHYVLSNGRRVNDAMLSKGFETSESRFFTTGQKKPSSVFLRYRKGDDGQGHYSIDSDSHLDSSRELSMTGVLLEKLLTAPIEEVQKYKLAEDGSCKATPEDNGAGSYHYTAYGKILVRSQLDAYDPRLPGAGIFDLKTRACAAVRLDWEERSMARVSNYQIRDNLGLWESFEREQFDLMRTAMLKYSLQVRLGRMDGIFLAYHNTAKMFGFQYMPLEEMDLALHGQRDRSLGDQELAISMGLLESIMDRATSRYPEQTLWIHFDTRFFKAGPFLRIFIEPINDELCDRLKTQSKQRLKQSVAAESSISQMSPVDDSLSPEELMETRMSAENLAESAIALAKIMEENRLANLAELAEFGYQEEQVMEMMTKYFETIRNMDRFAVSAPPEDTEASAEAAKAFETEAEHVAAINAALTECQPLIDLFPEQRTKAQKLLRSAIISTRAEDASQSDGEGSTTAPEPEEMYLKHHEPTDLLAYELRIVNHVSGYGFVERPTNVTGTGSQRRLSVRASLKEVKERKSAMRTYDIMRKARLAHTNGADKFYDGWFFGNLLKLSEAGRRWSERQERRDRGKETVKFEPFDAV